MSKHSKWAKIKRAKGATDIKRAANFTKLARAVTVAAREGGGDPNFNFKLRTAIDAALAGNMPKDNIDRAIKRGTGGEEGTRIEEAVYEGFGPGGAAIMVVALTDNRNRTSSSLKHIFSVGGGNMGSSGAVQWMFEKKGIVRVEDVQSLPEDAELAIIDAGAEDIRLEDGGLVIKAAVEALAKVKGAVEAAGLKPSYVGIEWLAKEEVEATAKESLEKLIEELDADDDVDSVFTNARL